MTFLLLRFKKRPDACQICSLKKNSDLITVKTGGMVSIICPYINGKLH